MMSLVVPRVEYDAYVAAPVIRDGRVHVQGGAWANSGVDLDGRAHVDG